MTPEQSKALRGKMRDNLVSKFPSNAGANANKEYAGHAAVTDRLLEVDPEWTWKFLGDGTPVFDDVGGIWIELTVCGVTRIGYGFPERLKGGKCHQRSHRRCYPQRRHAVWCWLGVLV